MIIGYAWLFVGVSDLGLTRRIPGADSRNELLPGRGTNTGISAQYWAMTAEDPAKIVCVDIRTSRIRSRSRYIASNPMFTWTIVHLHPKLP